MAEGHSRIDTFVLGYCDNTRALLAHLDAEGPARLERVRVLDPDPAAAEMLRERGIDAATVDFRDAAALRATGLAGAATVIVFEQRLDGAWPQVTRVIRAVCPSAELLKVPAIPGTRTRRRRVAPPSAWRRLATWLRTAARFFDDLAEAR
jgi:hypothetical protein